MVSNYYTTVVACAAGEVDYMAWEFDARADRVLQALRLESGEHVYDKTLNPSEYTSGRTGRTEKCCGRRLRLRLERRSAFGRGGERTEQPASDAGEPKTPQDAWSAIHKPVAATVWYFVSGVI